MALWSVEWYIYNSMCENESKMWNGIFSFEFSFSRKSNLKIFRTRVNLIQCPYEWIIDKGLCYVKKNLEKNIFIFKALRSKSNFWIWKLFDLLRDFNSFLRIKKKRNSFLTTIFLQNENLLSFEKFLKNDDFQRTNFIPYFRPTFTRKNHILLIQIPYLLDRTSPSFIKFRQFFKLSRKFKTSSPLSWNSNNQTYQFSRITLLTFFSFHRICQRRNRHVIGGGGGAGGVAFPVWLYTCVHRTEGNDLTWT